MTRNQYDVAVMHDYFVDRLVHTRSIARLLATTRSKAAQGGGSVHDIQQEDVKGGNAVNLAHSLAQLGAKVLLITHSDNGHAALLRNAFKGLGVDLRVKPLPPGLTVAIEERVNVMVSDSGGAGNFPPNLLAANDRDSIRRSKIVCSVNWAANKRGTELLLALRRWLGKDATVFLNPSDVRDRIEGYSALVRLMKRMRLVDWISVNEFEAAATARVLRLGEQASGRLCSALSRALEIRVDLHTERLSYTSYRGSTSAKRTAWLEPKRLTGAGDCWDAASIFGFLRGMDDVDRLEFANAAARLHVKSDLKRPPTFPEVRRALG